MRLKLEASTVAHHRLRSLLNELLILGVSSELLVVCTTTTTTEVNLLLWVSVAGVVLSVMVMMLLLLLMSCHLLHLISYSLPTKESLWLDISFNYAKK